MQDKNFTSENFFVIVSIPKIDIPLDSKKAKDAA